MRNGIIRWLFNANMVSCQLLYSWLYILYAKTIFCRIIIVRRYKIAEQNLVCICCCWLLFLCVLTSNADDCSLHGRINFITTSS